MTDMRGMTAGTYASDMTCATEMAAAMIGAGVGATRVRGSVVMMVSMPVITPAIEDDPNVRAVIIARAIIDWAGISRIVARGGATGQ